MQLIMTYLVSMTELDVGKCCLNLLFFKSGFVNYEKIQKSLLKSHKSLPLVKDLLSLYLVVSSKLASG